MTDIATTSHSAELIGLAVCDRELTAALPSEEGIESVTVAIPSGSTVADTIVRSILPRLSTDRRVAFAISNDNPQGVNRMLTVGGHWLIPVPPASATLAGLNLGLPDNGVQLQSGDCDGKSSLLKVGFGEVTFAHQGEPEQVILHTRVLTTGSDLLTEFSEFIGSPRANQMMGDKGWYYLASFLRSRGRTPEPITRKLMLRAIDPNGEFIPAVLQELRRNLCISAILRHPFAGEVARIMGDTLGRALGYVARQSPCGVINLQDNGISVVGGMPELLRPHLTKYLPEQTTLRFVPEQLQIVEATGAREFVLMLRRNRKVALGRQFASA